MLLYIILLIRISAIRSHKNDKDLKTQLYRSLQDVNNFLADLQREIRQKAKILSHDNADYEFGNYWNFGNDFVSNNDDFWDIKTESNKSTEEYVTDMIKVTKINYQSDLKNPNHKTLMTESNLIPNKSFNEINRDINQEKYPKNYPNSAVNINLTIDVNENQMEANKNNSSRNYANTENSKTLIDLEQKQYFKKQDSDLKGRFTALSQDLRTTVDDVNPSVYPNHTNTQTVLEKPGRDDNLNATQIPEVGNGTAYETTTMTEEPEMQTDELKSKPFTKFLLDITRIIAMKDAVASARLIGATETVIAKFLQQHKFMGFREPFVSTLHHVANGLNSAPANFLKAQMALFHHALQHRNKTLKKDTNTLIDYIDFLYSEHDEDAIEIALKKIEAYPNVTETAYDIMKNTIEVVILNPFQRLSGTLERRILVDTINKYITKRLHPHALVHRSKKKMKGRREGKRQRWMI